MIANCQTCYQNKEINFKYVKLAQILQAKCNKASKSQIENQTFTLDTVLPRITLKKCNSININIQESFINDKITTVNNEKIKYHKLSLLIIFNHHKKFMLKQGFSGIKQVFIQKMFQKKFKSTSNNLNIHQNHQNITQIIKNQNNGVALKHKNIDVPQNRNIQAPQYNLKQVYKKNFILQAKNSKYQQNIVLLKKQLEQTEKRYFKQSDKKRESLESVAQEIRQKDQLIVELKQTIKIYQKKLGKSTFFLATNNILIQNEQQISKRCTRLESVNQSLNLQVRNANCKIEQLNQQLKNCYKSIKQFQNQICSLKQLNFDLSQQKLKSDEVKSLYSQLCCKFNKKMEKIRRMEKQNIQACKFDQNQTSKQQSLTKNTEITDFSPVSKKSTFKEFQMQQKIQQIFSYLYDIQDEKREIINEYIFDQDELNLLKQHKNNYLTNIRLKSERNEMKTQKIIKNDKMDETDQIFYVQIQNELQQNSFFNALQSEPKSIPSANQQTSNIKLMQMTIQNSKLVDKISDLKNVNMHTRNVILNLLKTLDFSTAKPQYENILQIIFDMYEYSEQQKTIIFKDKKKRFWGLL